MLNTYVVTRENLSPANQAVQGMHALAELAVRHPIHFETWNKQGGNTLVFVTVPDTKALARLEEAAKDGGIIAAAFYEPDWSPEPVLTAIAFAPNWTVQYGLLADLPLALPPSKIDMELLEQDAKQYRALIGMSARQRRKHFRNLAPGFFSGWFSEDT